MILRFENAGLFLFKPNDFVLQSKSDYVDKPEKWDSDNNQNNSKHDAERVFLFNALAKSVNHPNDVEKWNSKQNLGDFWQSIDSIYKLTHNSSFLIIYYKMRAFVKWLCMKKIWLILFV